MKGRNAATLLVLLGACSSGPPTPEVDDDRDDVIDLADDGDDDDDAPLDDDDVEDGDADDDPPVDEDDVPVERDPADPVADGCADLDGGTGMTTAAEMFDYLNASRTEYAFHMPFDGYPWQGTSVEQASWPVTQQWDDELAAVAQEEAGRLAAGGTPEGREFGYQNAQLCARFDHESVWLTGIDTARYQISARSDPTIVEGCSTPMKWHALSNGTIRQAVYYQTGSAPFDRKDRLGVGKACTPDGEVWWVILYGQ